MQSAMTMWLVAAMLQWTAGYGRAPERVAYLGGVADDILAVAFDATERPIFKGPHGRARTALLIASVAAQESAYQRRIQDGHCRQGECDGGAAYCMMQIHPGSGIRLLDANPDWTFAKPSPDQFAYTAQDLIDDRSDCFRVGLHMVRRSLRQTRSLCNYIGYTDNGCWQGKMRMQNADQYFDEHAPPAIDAELVVGFED